MKNCIFRYVLLGMVVCLFPLVADARGIPQKFYVSVRGDDHHTGSENAPWKDVEVSCRQVFDYMRSHPGKDVQLYLMDGTYPVRNPILLDGTGLTGHLSISAVHSGRAVLDGRALIFGFGKVKDSSLSLPVTSNALPHLLQANLTPGDFSDLGVPVGGHNRMDLYCNDDRQQLARWPNEDYDTIQSVLGPTPAEYGAKKEGIFTYRDTHIDGYASLDQLYAYGLWHWGWSDDYSKVQSIDPRKHVMTLVPPYHYFGYKTGARFFLLNSLQDLDSPGEYYIDRAKRILFWYPPKNYRAGKDQVWLSVFKGTSMLLVKNLDHITLDGLSLVGGRENAIAVEAGKQVKILNCHVRDFGGSGITVQGGSDLLIEGCLIENTGEYGIQLTGGDRKLLAHSGFAVKNTIIRNFSQYKRTMRQGIWFKGCGLTISHNEISNSPGSALRFEGNDVMVEHNYIHDVVTENSDNGAVDIYNNPSYRGIVIRYNYWKHITGAGTIDNVAAVRLDDMISGVTIDGNVFDHCGSSFFGAIQINGGKDNEIHHNVFYYCTRPVSIQTWEKGRWQTALDQMHKTLYQDVDIYSVLYVKAYPQLKTIGIYPGENRITDNLLIHCQKSSLKDPRFVHSENNSVLTTNGEASFRKALALCQAGVLQNPYKSVMRKE